MHYLADFDNQTKLLHVGYSVLGMLVSMLVLVKFKPTILPRMVTAVMLGFVLVFCLSTPLTGDQERLKNLYSIGWFSLGLLFGIGRGEFVIEYLTRRFFGAPDQLAEQLAKAEASVEADGSRQMDKSEQPDSSRAVATGKLDTETCAEVIVGVQQETHAVINTNSGPKAEPDVVVGEGPSARELGIKSDVQAES